MTRLAQVAMPERENRRSPKFYLEAKWSRFLFCSLFCSFSHGFCTFSRAFFSRKVQRFCISRPPKRKKGGKSERPQWPTDPHTKTCALCGLLVPVSVQVPAAPGSGSWVAGSSQPRMGPDASGQKPSTASHCQLVFTSIFSPFCLLLTAA